jgi:hypothetical protein
MNFKLQEHAELFQVVDSMKITDEGVYFYYEDKLVISIPIKREAGEDREIVMKMIFQNIWVEKDGVKWECKR